MEIIFDPSLIALKQNISRAEEAIETGGFITRQASDLQRRICQRDADGI